MWRSVGEVWESVGGGGVCAKMWGSSLSGEVCWGVEGDEERWGCEKMWGRCGKVYWGVGEGVEKWGEWENMG